MDKTRTSFISPLHIPLRKISITEFSLWFRCVDEPPASCSLIYFTFIVLNNSWSSTLIENFLPIFIVFHWSSFPITLYISRTFFLFFLFSNKFNNTYIQIIHIYKKQGITWHLNNISIHMTIQLLWICIYIHVCVFIQDQVTTDSGAATQLSGLAMNW